MLKSQRLIELMMTVNRKRRFKVQELADEFGVSKRTILRDLQELSELGVPLYSEVGPHGGYQVIRERVLPPIAFTEEEAVAMFFAVHALRHYASLPFEAESASALSKFYLHMPGDTRDRIDSMKNRVDFITPARRDASPFLPMLLDAAVHQKVLAVNYESRDEGASSRRIQPVFLYANNGYWYCTAYCFERQGLRVFRGDRMRDAAYDTSGTEPLNLSGISVTSHEAASPMESLRLRAKLSRAGVQRCEAELWLAPMLQVGEDGSGTIAANMPRTELSFYAEFFIGLGDEVMLEQPAELKEAIRQRLSELLARYS
ncbi:Predicted DNA-binding transcriptional regulator YafY, contains an HTH and WYL domains [Paenibacillus sp. UNCCL117]|uniref:helix-turn-helix transcriptional regulator n=1 Tax=unclassified Paenibacillus TaxID=185978 RepID=UPI0008878CD4|nr:MULTISPECIES: YafY family protein [unclassified Paenibacillus]SDE11040.1 Predicted DNA-binding transcriptional regulator YafY, contains an HTH and WYL domains [Paenibacillus sp. cl123]SFW59910.1 Predicted DNA-binding transcriptional regulator YafY, contains an HTH and WYL domains [Paenibacillus sp. UNCCL117]